MHYWLIVKIGRSQNSARLLLLLLEHVNIKTTCDVRVPVHLNMMDVPNNSTVLAESLVMTN